jgi:hypothetical protein
LEADAEELFRLAGRDVGGASLERQALSDCRACAAMREVKDAVKRKGS